MYILDTNLNLQKLFKKNKTPSTKQPNNLKRYLKGQSTDKYIYLGM